MRFSIVLAISMILSTLVIQTAGQSMGFPRHVDPMGVREQLPDPATLARIMASYAAAIRSLDIYNSTSLLLEIRRIYVPEGYRFVIDRFANLSREFLDRVNDSDASLDIAESRIGISDISGALSALGYAEANISRASYILNLLEDAIKGLNIIGIPDSVSRDTAESHRYALNFLIERLRRLMDEVEGLKIRSMDTLLEINASPRKIWVGDPIDIWGYLRDARGDPLPGRAVRIHIGSLVIDTVTRDDGLYMVSEPLNIYTPTVSIYSEYIPSGDDVNRYRYSRSNVVPVEVLFIRPNLSIALDRYSYTPGSRMIITVSSDLDVEASLDLGFRVIEGLRIYGGSPSTIEVDIPLNISEGSYTARIVSRASGVIAPSEAMAIFTVTRMPASLDVEAPLAILTGIPTQIPIKASTSGVIIYRYLDFEGFVEAVGASKAVITIYIPPTYIMQSASIEIILKPHSPEYRGARVSIEVRVINTPILAMIGAIMLYIAYRSAMLIKKTGLGKAGLAIPERVGPAKQRGGDAQRDQELSVGGMSTPARIYVEVMRIIEALTGISIKGYETLREYYRRVSGLLGALGASIWDFLMVYERILYGREGESPSLVERLRKIYESILRLARIG